jgi:ATP-binding cassette subfamily B multidrug efflux pump
MKSFALIKPYAIANRYRILFGLSCLIVVDLLQLFIPRVIKQVVDDLTRLQVDRSSLLNDAMIIMALGLCIGIFRFFWRRSLMGTARRLKNPCETVFSRMSRPFLRHTSTGPHRRPDGACHQRYPAGAHGLRNGPGGIE